MIPLAFIGSTEVGVRIERLSDHTFYDPSDGKFKPTVSSLIPLPPYRPGLYRTDLAITPEFTDSKYVASYFSLSDFKVMYWYEFDIIHGKYQALSSRDIAKRVMESRVGGGTVRDALEKIDIIYDWVINQKQEAERGRTTKVGD